MNKMTAVICSILVFCFIFSCSTTEQKETLDEAMFINPSKDTALHAWWHWMDGAITKEGITKDLESMHRQGIVQATIFNVGLFDGRDFGVPRVTFASDEWFGMFKWAVEEADRLGIRIGVHNCDGWATSAGPWITPDKSMKHYVWTKTMVNGGDAVNVKLPQPPGLHDYYVDEAVVAYRSSFKINSFQKAAPKIELNDKAAGVLADGSPVSQIRIDKGEQISITFKGPFTASDIAVFPYQMFLWNSMDAVRADFILTASNDGINYFKIMDFESKGLNKTQKFSFKPVTARFFRLEYNGARQFGSDVGFMLSELALLNGDEEPAYNPNIPYHLEKAVFVKSDGTANFNKQAKADPDAGYISKDDIVNLTGKMQADGTLQWQAPEGNWEIIRFGYTTTGSTNGPATAEGLGLECDKMDASALDLHFNSFPKKLVKTAGIHTGNTFKFLMVDSWECQYQNWTAKFAAEFEKRRGYSLYSFLPVLCGVTVESPQVSESVLYDFRKTIAELIEDNYYKHYKELCHKNKLEYHSEAIYGGDRYPPVDILKANSYIDMPMDEFWAYEWTGGRKEADMIYIPSGRSVYTFPASAAELYNKKIVGAEAYTGFTHYSENPEKLAPFGNRAYCVGINQFILHSYVHQPFDKAPGMTLGQYASHFNRLNPWWQLTDTWSEYHARVQYVLQKGETQFDVLFYVGDQLPQKVEKQMINQLPAEYNALCCNLDVLQNKISVQDGKLVLSGSQTFSVLVLPENQRVEPQTLQRIAELVEQGATVIAERPQAMLSFNSMKNSAAQFASLTDMLWGKDENATANNYGAGRVVWNKSIAEVLDDIKLAPDFTTNLQDQAAPLFIHKKIDDVDVYFLTNQQGQNVHCDCAFRTTKVPAIWDPETGEISEVAIYSIKNDQIFMPVSFRPYEAKLFVFKPDSAKDHIVMVESGSKQLFPGDAGIASAAVPNAVNTDAGIELTADQGGGYTLLDNKGEESTFLIRPPQVHEIRNFDGKIEFKSSYNADIAPVSISNLKSLTDFRNSEIKYFGGMAQYSIGFDLPQDLVQAGELELDLGDISATASVVLNGDTLATAWHSGTIYKVSGLKATGNLLQVKVACLYRNRIIGDLREYGKVQTIWTTAPYQMFMNKKSILQPSGLVGPIRLIKPEKVVL